MLDNNQSKIELRKNKYASKYFGVATGVLAVILFMLIILNSAVSNINEAQLIKPFIPFWNGMSIPNIAGGIFISFICQNIIVISMNMMNMIITLLKISSVN